MKTLNCPICKAEPVLEINPMFENGHGYYGCYSYRYSCKKCKLLSSNGADTVYTDKSLVQEKALKSWNDEVNRVRVLMGKPAVDYVVKEPSPQTIQIDGRVFASKEVAEKTIFDWITNSEGSEQSRCVEALLKLREGATNIKL